MEKMITVKTIPGKEVGGDEGQWWRGLIQVHKNFCK
jgi:hypothetical protein